MSGMKAGTGDTHHGQALVLPKSDKRCRLTKLVPQTRSLRKGKLLP
jgi:hypothetical protein